MNSQWSTIQFSTVPGLSGKSSVRLGHHGQVISRVVFPLIFGGHTRYECKELPKPRFHWSAAACRVGISNCPTGHTKRAWCQVEQVSPVVVDIMMVVILLLLLVVFIIVLLIYSLP